MKRLALTILSAALGAGEVGAQTQVSIVDPGPGTSGRMLIQALSRPHRLVEPDTSWFILRRSEPEPGSLIILDRTAAIEGTVEGDVIVVGGDLFIRPRARVTGRAVAIGGGVYPSSLSLVLGESHSFRDNTFSIDRDSGGYRLSYRSLYMDAAAPITFPGFRGLRLLTYDRVNGVSISFGPVLSFAQGRGELSAVASYRSHLGAIDPALMLGLGLTSRFRVEARAERGTFSNDRWIRSDLMNSLTALAFGTDTRNYYRADRAEVTAHRAWESRTTRLEPFLGIRGERAWSTGPIPGELRGPWSIFRKSDTLDGMWRRNPPVSHAGLYSALAGSTLRWESRGVLIRGRTLAEHLVDATEPGAVVPARPFAFTQVTSNMDVGFPTFHEQHYRADVHWVTTVGDATPPQRYVYLGGTGTMLFLDLLEQGGDELLLVDQTYSIPLTHIELGFFGSPTLQLRHRLGGAGVRELPALEQTISLSLQLSLLRGDVQLDPSTGNVRFSTAFVFAR